jgi:hypothetical protein
MRFEPLNYLIYKHEPSSYEGVISSFTDENALYKYFAGSGLRSYADLSESPLPYIVSAAQYDGARVDPFMQWLDNYATTTFIDEENFTWRLRTKGQNHMTITQSLYCSTDCIGVGDDEFEIALDQEGLHSGDVLSPVRSLTYGCQIRLTNDGIKSGTTIIYTAQNWTIDDSESFPIEYLEAGQKWKYLYHPVGEATSRRGSFQSRMSSGWLEFGGSLMPIGIEGQVTDKAGMRHLSFHECSADGMRADPKPKYIINAVEAEFIASTKQHEKNVILYSKPVQAPLTKSRYLDQSSGYAINGATGLVNGYLLHSNFLEYPVDAPIIPIIKDQMVTLLNQRKNYNEWRWTITGGLKFIEKAIDELKTIYNGIGLQRTEAQFTKSAAPIANGRRGLKISHPQITSIDFDVFGSIDFIHLEEFDNGELGGWEVNFRGAPISSWWGFCMNVGLNNQRKKNFEILRKKNSTIFTYYEGTIGPMGPHMDAGGGGGRTSHNGNWYDIIWQTTLGFRAENVNDIIWFVPNITA